MGSVRECAYGSACCAPASWHHAMMHHVTWKGVEPLLGHFCWLKAQAHAHANTYTHHTHYTTPIPNVRVCDIPLMLIIVPTRPYPPCPDPQALPRWQGRPSPRQQQLQQLRPWLLCRSHRHEQLPRLPRWWVGCFVTGWMLYPWITLGLPLGYPGIALEFCHVTIWMLYPGIIAEPQHSTSCPSPMCCKQAVASPALHHGVVHMIQFQSAGS